MKRQTIAVISFSPIARDARVLRQLRYLAPDYDLIVVGQGPVPDQWAGRAGVTWVNADKKWRRIVAIARLPILLLSRFSSRVFDLWYWSSPAHLAAFAAADRVAPPDLAAIHANDWNTLPLALRLASTRASRVVLDLHEFAPLEFEERLLWRAFYPAPIRALLRRSASRLAATITVAPAIAERYRLEFGLDPVVVLNAPDSVEVSDHAVDPERIRMIHHGAAQHGRQLELLIDVVAGCDPRFSLDFMLVGDPEYIDELRGRAKRLDGERIHFRDPVPPDQILAAIADYDIGLFLLPPSSFSKAESLPNKLFDFITAGMAVIVGPTPAMASFVRANGIGLVTESFDPEVAANTLNRLDAKQIEAMRTRSRDIRHRYTAATEMAKVVALYQGLLT
jgi:glycosyltransferase involved in cell wall biosynthesis